MFTGKESFPGDNWIMFLSVVLKRHGKNNSTENEFKTNLLCLVQCQCTSLCCFVPLIAVDKTGLCFESKISASLFFPITIKSLSGTNGESLFLSI